MVLIGQLALNVSKWVFGASLWSINNYPRSQMLGLYRGSSRGRGSLPISVVVIALPIGRRLHAQPRIPVGRVRGGCGATMKTPPAGVSGVSFPQEHGREKTAVAVDHIFFIKVVDILPHSNIFDAFFLLFPMTSGDDSVLHEPMDGAHVGNDGGAFGMSGLSDAATSATSEGNSPSIDSHEENVDDARVAASDELYDADGEEVDYPESEESLSASEDVTPSDEGGDSPDPSIPSSRNSFLSSVVTYEGQFWRSDHLDFLLRIFSAYTHSLRVLQQLRDDIVAEFGQQQAAIQAKEVQLRQDQHHTVLGRNLAAWEAHLNTREEELRAREAACESAFHERLAAFLREIERWDRH